MELTNYKYIPYQKDRFYIGKLTPKVMLMLDLSTGIICGVTLNE